jgi:Flp pilus assembly CpaE family ATPase
VFSETIRLENSRLCFVFNHYQPFVSLGREQFETALEQPLSHEIPHAGEIAYKAAAKGEPLALSSSGSAFAKALEKLTRGIIPADARPVQRKPGGMSLLNRPRTAPQPKSDKASSSLLSMLRGKHAS